MERGGKSVLTQQIAYDINTLNKKGLNPQYFINKQNNLSYVYLKYFNNWEEVITTYNSKIDGNYQDDIYKTRGNNLKFDQLS